MQSERNGVPASEQWVSFSRRGLHMDRGRTQKPGRAHTLVAPKSHMPEEGRIHRSRKIAPEFTPHVYFVILFARMKSHEVCLQHPTIIEVIRSSHCQKFRVKTVNPLSVVLPNASLPAVSSIGSLFRKTVPDSGKELAVSSSNFQSSRFPTRTSTFSICILLKE